MTTERRNGFALLDVYIGSIIVALAMGAFFPSLDRAREQSNRIKCASNLKQIGLGMIMYANNETRNGQSFPRTYYKPDVPLTGTDAGSTVPSPGYNQHDSFAPDEKGSPVGVNNVMASFFLVAKTQDLAPAVFCCPSNDVTPDPFGAVSPAQPDPSGYSSWDAPANKYLSYSMQVPFPTSAAIQLGFKWNMTLASEFALAADLNPGAAALLTVTPGGAPAQMQKANSFNHGGDGQNVLYADGHVDWMTSPFCGPMRGAGASQFSDNIYTYGVAPGPTGIIGSPQDNLDCILLPIAGANAPHGAANPDGVPMARALTMLGIAVIVVALVVVAIVLMTRRKPQLPPPLPPMAA